MWVRITICWTLLLAAALPLQAQVVTVEITPAQHRRQCNDAREFLRTGRPTWVGDSVYAFMVIRWCGEGGLGQYMKSWWAEARSTDSAKIDAMARYAGTIGEPRLRDTLEALVASSNASLLVRLRVLEVLERGRAWGTAVLRENLDRTPIDAPCQLMMFTDDPDEPLSPRVVERSDDFLARILDSEAPYQLRRLAYCWLDIHHGLVLRDPPQPWIALAIRRSLVEEDLGELESAYERSWESRDARVAAAALQVAGSRIAGPNARLFALRALWWADDRSSVVSLPTDSLLVQWNEGRELACPARSSSRGIQDSDSFPVTRKLRAEIRLVAARLAADPSMTGGVRSFAGCFGM